MAVQNNLESSLKHKIADDIVFAEGALDEVLKHWQKLKQREIALRFASKDSVFPASDSCRF